MTKAAQEFVGKATLAALTDNEVLTDIFPDTPKAGLEHIQMAINLDAVLVIPATANILAKAAAGIADDLVSTTLAVCEQPTLFAPAMNFRMWQNEAISEAVQKLRDRGKSILDPESGQLASLHEGEGRLPEIPAIMNAIRELFKISLPLKDKRILVTAGPTREPIDPVRYISNRSSGKMGYALAQTCRDMGAEVHLISGPVSLPQIPEVTTDYVETASEMFTAVEDSVTVNDPDIVFMTAAVADFTIADSPEHKIKRGETDLLLKLQPAIDILQTLKGRIRGKLVAFALETRAGENEAIRKMKSKNADFIVLNYANEEGAGFDSVTNRVTVFSKDGRQTDLKKDRKDRIARRLIDVIIS